MSLIEEIRKSSEGATKVRARVVAEISRIENEIGKLTEQRALVNRSPMSKDDYLQYMLADVDARFERAASRLGADVLNLFTLNAAERMRCTATPPTIDGTENFRRNSGVMWATERIFGKIDQYDTAFDMWCFLGRDDVKESIKKMFDILEWPFSEENAGGERDGNRRSTYIQDGLIHLVAEQPLAVLAQESEKLSDQIHELSKQRDALLEEAEERGFAL